MGSTHSIDRFTKRHFRIDLYIHSFSFLFIIIVDISLFAVYFVASCAFIEIVKDKNLTTQLQDKLCIHVDGDPWTLNRSHCQDHLIF